MSNHQGRPIRHSSRLGLIAAIGLLLFLPACGLFSDDEEQGEGGGHGGGEFVGDPRPESQRQSPVPLNVEAGSEIGLVYEAFPSPQQEGGDEDEAPEVFPEEFLSSKPSTPREERTSRAHAVLEFTRDLSRAYLYVELVNVDPDDIELFHLHCGRPGELGPIIVDFGLMGDVRDYFEDGKLTMEITNADIEAVIDSGEGILGFLSFGCRLGELNPETHIVTIGGLEEVARKGELYFNLHTGSHTFFGEARGAFYPVGITE